MLSASRIEQLTGLRFLAALGVLLCHWYILAPQMGPQFLFELGGHGVTLFFILSGFVLTWRYDTHQDTPTPTGRPTQQPLDGTLFAITRVARIAPLYWLALLLTGLAYWLFSPAIALGPAPQHTTDWVVGWALNMLALQAWVPNESVQQFWNAPGWSISAEFFFYACFPWLLQRHWLSGSAQSFAGVLVFFGFLVGLYLVGWPLWSHEETLMLSFASRLPLLGLLPFVVGMLCCRMLRRYHGWHRHQSGWTVVVGLLLVGTAWLTNVWTDAPLPLQTQLLVSYFMYVPLFALLIVSVALDEGPIGRWLCSPTLVLLGNASYALYLLHWLPLGMALHWVGPGQASLPMVMAGMLGLIVLSVGAYLWFEAPLRVRVSTGLQRLLCDNSRMV